MTGFELFMSIVGMYSVIYLIWFLHAKGWLFWSIIIFGIAASFGPMSGWDALKMTLTFIFCYAFLDSNIDRTPRRI